MRPKKSFGFGNDSLHRLDYSTLNGNPTPNVDLDYDALGNITKKTDVAASGAWTYDPVKKHRLVSAAGGVVTFTYDANGNAITRNGSTITWTSYNYPRQVNNGTEYNQFFYGPDRERWKQNYVSASGTETTISLGKFLEIVTKGGVTDWRHYIYAAGQPIAVYSRKNSGNTVRYVLGDHIGSVAALTTSGGSIEVNESFTAFGQRRNGTTWQLPLPGADDTTIGNATRRGFTFHNDLGGMPLNHMNGRVQDAMTGRFLSADPHVTEPGFTQAWNRYSYVFNNPLAFSDPSGFDPDCTPTHGVDTTPRAGWTQVTITDVAAGTETTYTTWQVDLISSANQSWNGCIYLGGGGGDNNGQQQTPAENEWVPENRDFVSCREYVARQEGPQSIDFSHVL